ncbi:hypothetical protein OQA88_10543 [Cercophora sp. LCS_1]
MDAAVSGLYLEPSPFGSPVITLEFGLGDRLTVHRDLIPQNSKLYPTDDEKRVIDLAQISGNAGHVLVHYLYTDRYKELQWIGKKLLDAEATLFHFKTAFQVYAAARIYELGGLEDLAIDEIERLSEMVDVFSVIDTVREVYPKPAADDYWFPGFVKDKIKDALKDGSALSKADCPIDFSDGIGFAKLLVKGVMEVYRDMVEDLDAAKVAAQQESGPCSESTATRLPTIKKKVSFDEVVQHVPVEPVEDTSMEEPGNVVSPVEVNPRHIVEAIVISEEIATSEASVYTLASEEFTDEGSLVHVEMSPSSSSSSDTIDRRLEIIREAELDPREPPPVPEGEGWFEPTIKKVKKGKKKGRCPDRLSIDTNHEFEPKYPNFASPVAVASAIFPHRGSDPEPQPEPTPLTPEAINDFFADLKKSHCVGAEASTSTTVPSCDGSIENKPKGKKSKKKKEGKAAAPAASEIGHETLKHCFSHAVLSGSTQEFGIPNGQATSTQACPPVEPLDSEPSANMGHGDNSGQSDQLSGGPIGNPEVGDAWSFWGVKKGTRSPRQSL